MVNTLTWRDVTAPDFSTALRGLDVAGRNATQGFDTLGQALGNFQTYRQGEAANAVLNNAAGYSDPEALRAAIANGSVFGGIDRSLVTPQTLAALNVQPGTLLGQGLEQEKLSYLKQADPHLLNALQDADTVNAATQAARIAKSGLDNQKTTADIGFTNAQTGEVSSQTKTLDQTRQQGGTLFANSQNDRNDNIAAQTAVADAMRNAAPGRPDQAVTAFEQANLSPRQRAIGQEMLRQQVPGAYGSPATDAIGAASGGGGGRGGAGSFTPGASPTTNLPLGSSSFLVAAPAETRAYVPSILNKAGPLTGSNEDKVQKLMPHLIQQESGGDPNALSPKGAWGLTGIMPATAANPGFGVKPIQSNASPQEQKQFGHDYLLAMMNKYNGDPEKALAAYNAGPGAVDGWLATDPGAIKEDVRNSDIKVATLIRDASTSRNLQDGSGIAAQYKESMQNQPVMSADGKTIIQPKKMNEVVDDLMKSNAYKDIDPGLLTGYLQDIINKSDPKGPPITPAAAGAIFAKYTTGIDHKNFISRTFGFRDKASTNDEAIQKEVDAIQHGVRQEGSTQGSSMVAAASAVQEAQKDYSDAASALIATQRQAVNTPGASANLQHDTDVLANAKKIRDDRMAGYLKSYGKDGGLDGQFLKPPAANTTPTTTQVDNPFSGSGAKPNSTPTLAPASTAISAVVSSPAYQIAKQRADAASAALEAAEARNDPQRDRYQNEAEAADSVLNELIAAAKPSKNADPKQTQNKTGAPNMGLITNRPVGAALSDLIHSMRQQTGQPYTPPKFDLSYLIGAASRD